MAVVLLIAGAVAVLLMHVSGRSATARAGRRLEASVQPELPRGPSEATLRANAARELRARENEAIDRLLRRQPFIAAGGTQRREIALTFDDGPGPYTPRLLDELERLHVPATFFEIGFMFRWFHASAVHELHMGDVIGDHTETHPPMALLTSALQRAEILDQTAWLHKYRAPFSRLWRPPYGSYDAATLHILRRLHMLMVLWTVDTDDYLRPGVSVIVHRALAAARPGAIVLMHDGGGNRAQHDRRAAADRARAAKARLPAGHDPAADPERPAPPDSDAAHHPPRRLTPHASPSRPACSRADRISPQVQAPPSTGRRRLPAERARQRAARQAGQGAGGQQRETEPHPVSRPNRGGLQPRVQLLEREHVDTGLRDDRAEGLARAHRPIQRS